MQSSWYELGEGQAPEGTEGLVKGCNFILGAKVGDI